jgi:molecular chaperone IbpA
MHSEAEKRFVSNFIGEYDELEKMMSFMNQEVSSTHPSHDIVKYRSNGANGDEKFEIVIALPGFEKKNISIATEGNKLKISGANENGNEDKEFLFQGIMRGSFMKSFTLSPNIHVSGAKMENGLLTVSLIKKLPDELKEKQILID